MADIAQLLDTMHPMREPAAPEPIAPYLILLAAGCMAALFLLFAGWRIRHRRVALRTSAEAALAATRGLAPADRLAAQATLLRRLVRSLQGDEAARAQGRAWLERLDGVFETRFFTQGHGVAFGEGLYHKPRDVDIDALDRSLRGLIAKVRV
jgi:hypothetical protein